MVSYSDVKHILNEEKKNKKVSKRTGKGARTAKKFHKGSASKTHPGEKDFTTKKTSKYFDRKGKRSTHAKGSFIERLPYHMERIFGVKMTKHTKKESKGKKGKGKGKGKRSNTARKSRKSRK